MKRTAKDAARLAMLISESGLAVSIAADKAHAEAHATAGISAEERAEIAARVAVNTDVLALISKHGLSAILESIQHGAELARDVEDGEVPPRIVSGLASFAEQIGSARTVIS